MIILFSITLGLYAISICFLIAKRIKENKIERARKARRDAIKRGVGE